MPTITPGLTAPFSVRLSNEDGFDPLALNEFLTPAAALKACHAVNAATERLRQIFRGDV